MQLLIGGVGGSSDSFTPPTMHQFHFQHILAVIHPPNDLCFNNQTICVADWTNLPFTSAIF